MQVTKKWIVLPATLALGVSSIALGQQNRDNDPTAREKREQREQRQERRADAQSGIPEKVQRAIEQRYPKAKLQPVSSATQNGVQTYLVRIDTASGETTARATERGDFFYLGYPGVSYDRLPRSVTQILDGMFNSKPETVQKYENTTYLVDADFGGKSYQLQLDAAGRLVDARPSNEVKREDPSQYPRGSRSDEQALQPRLNDYFDNAKVKSIHRFPDADGYFWVNLSTATEDNVWVLMDTKRDVAEYRTRVSGNDVPQPVTRAMKEFFKGAKVDEVYRNNSIHYNVLQPVGDEAVLLAINPLGDITRIRQANAVDIRREFADREPNELFRNRDQKRGENDRDDNANKNSNRTNTRND